MVIWADHKPDIASNPVLRFLKRHFRITVNCTENGFSSIDQTRRPAGWPST